MVCTGLVACTGDLVQHDVHGRKDVVGEACGLQGTGADAAAEGRAASGTAEGEIVPASPPAAKAVFGLSDDNSLVLNDSAKRLDVEAQQPVEGAAFKLLIFPNLVITTACLGCGHHSGWGEACTWPVHRKAGGRVSPCFCPRTLHMQHSSDPKGMLNVWHRLGAASRRQLCMHSIVCSPMRV